MVRFARVFQLGNSQVVRLPEEFRFSVDRVEVTREGGAVILRPHVDQKEPWASLRQALRRSGGNHFGAGGRDWPAPQDRPDLDTAFE